jgi:hypothetical protein
MTGDNNHQSPISKIVNQLTPPPPPSNSPTPIIEPIVAWVVLIGSLKMDDIINQIEVDIRIVKTTELVIVKNSKSFPTVSLTDPPRRNAPKIANITAKIRISLIFKVLEPYIVAIVSSFAPIANEINTEIIMNIMTIVDKLILIPL